MNGSCDMMNDSREICGMDELVKMLSGVRDNVDRIRPLNTRHPRRSKSPSKRKSNNKHPTPHMPFAMESDPQAMFTDPAQFMTLRPPRASSCTINSDDVSDSDRALLLLFSNGTDTCGEPCVLRYSSACVSTVPGVSRVQSVEFVAFVQRLCMEQNYELVTMNSMSACVKRAVFGTK